MKITNTLLSLALVALLHVLFISPVTGQESLELPLESSQFRVYVLTPAAPSADRQFSVESSTRIRIEYIATSAGVLPTIITPSQLSIDSTNIGSYGGSFSTFQNQNTTPGIWTALSSIRGFHGVIDLPSLGNGSYTLRLSAPAGITDNIALAAAINTDSSVSVKLFTSVPHTVSGRAVSLTAAIFDGVTALTNVVVNVSVRSPSGIRSNVTLHDNGMDVDDAVGDGLFSGEFVPTEVGTYTAFAEITGTTSGSVQFWREASTEIEVRPNTSRLTGTVRDFGETDPADSRFLKKIVIEADTLTTVAGSYSLTVLLRTTNGQHLNSATTVDLAVGAGLIRVGFEADEILGLGENGPFNIELVQLIKVNPQTGNTVVDSLRDVGQTQAYQLNQMSRPRITFTGANSVVPIDLNGNGKYEALTFQIGVNVTDESDYDFTASLFDSNRNKIDDGLGRSHLVEGNNTISFTITAERILAHAQPGPFQVGNVVIWDGASSRVNYDVMTTDPYALSQFEIGPELAFTGSQLATGIDANSNGKFENLRIQSQLYVGHSGGVSLQAKLKDGSGNVIQTVYKGFAVFTGVNSIQFDFDGYYIFNANVNGPLTVADVTVTNDAGNISVPELFVTQPFNSNQFEIGLEFTGSNTVQGVDANQNGLYESLKIQTQLYAFYAGSYVIQVSLRAPDGSTIQTINRTQNLSTGNNLLEFNFSGSLIKQANINGPLTVGNVSVSGVGRVLQVPVLFTTPSFSSSQFESLFDFVGGYSSTGVDLNANGKFDRLRFQGSINVVVPGSYAVVAILQDSNGNSITNAGLFFNFVSGINTFTLDFQGNPIFHSHVNGPYRISLQAWDNPARVTFIAADNVSQTAAFNYTDFEQTLGFTGQNTATGIDTNANGKFETLRITTGILIQVAGYYGVSASLKDSNGSLIRTITYQTTLQAGANTLTFDFDGVTIHNHGVAGPYTLADAWVARQVNPADGFNQATVFTTPLFTIDQFDPGTSDLHFVSYRFVPTAGDGDSSLEPGESADLFVTIANHDTGYARNTTAALTSTSPHVEVLSGAQYGTVAVTEKEGTPFSIRLRADAPYGTTIPFTLSIGYDVNQSTTRNFSVQTGRLNRILYNQVVQNRDQIFSMNSDGSDRRNLSNTTFDDYEPVSAPNGGKIAFQRLINNGSSELWIMNSDGTGKQKLADLQGFWGPDLTWSPDSTRIAFLAEVSNVADLFVINADGTGLVRITNTADTESYVAWSSTNKIAYTTNWGEDVRVVNPDGTGNVLVHDNPTNDLYIYDLSWSPDGAWIGWINERRVTQPSHYYEEVYIARHDGTEKRNLTTNAEAERFVWSPDSTRIAYVHDMDDFYLPQRIIVTNVATGQAMDLSSFANTVVYRFNVDVGSGDPKWSPDGRSIAFVGRESVSYPFPGSPYSIFTIETATGLTNKVALGSGSTTYKPEWENLDRVPPASVISMTPSANSQGWNTSDVTVGIAATDNVSGSGVQSLTYSSTGAQTIGSTTVNGSAATVTIFGEGVTSLLYSAKDNRNNLEDMKTHTVRIDKSLPVSSHTSSNSGSQTAFTLTASDAVSGVGEILYSVDGGGWQSYAGTFNVSSTGGHSISYFARDVAGNEETPRTTYINPELVAKSVLISEFRTRGYLGADDEFIELYNNSDTPVDISGWSLSVKHGTITTPILLATINSGSVIPARGHYLLRKAGTSNYSLSSYAEADQTYSDSLGDNCGIKLLSGSSIAIDAVGFGAVSDATYREGTGISPSAGISTNGQHSFARNFVKQLPVDSNNNKTDFAFVSSDGATYNNLKSILGSPGPENLASPIYREGNVLISQIDTGVTLAEAPNRVFNYTNPPAQYPVGVLSVRRKLTNNTGAAISQIRVRITAITTKNSAIVFPQQALLRLFNSADISVTSADGQTNIPLKGLSVEAVPTTGDGGLNSSFTVPLGPGGLSAGQSLNIDLKAGIVTNGQYKLEFRIETVQAGP